MQPLRSTAVRGTKARRGQPVVALAMILTMWIAVRATFIALESAPAPDPVRMVRLSAPQRSAARAPERQEPAGSDRQDEGLAALCALPALVPGADPAELQPQAVAMADFVPRRQSRNVRRLTRTPHGFGAVPEALTEASEELEGPRMFYPALPGVEPRQADGAPSETARPRVPRWSADGWLLLRGDQAPALAAGAAAYGGSQAGAVLRFGFAPANRLRPQAYMRFSSALSASVQQKEVALGLMVRPVPRLPVALLGEWRLQEQGGSNRSRPVVMAVTELAPLQLPFGVEADAYAQGGWAGGRDATLFYDLATTFQRPVARPLRGTQMSAGGGLWSGGQRGAVRLDVGPRIELRGMVGPPARRIGVRVGVDWRFRVAGRAEPGSGPALTVAAGF
ncbi:hypothetical protein [Novosphingobium sp.]|uniref:hypothetical protein n=1 Tax=Novosphingobium sp. TaxID=1874826 RepID=UPI003BAD61DD